MFVVMRQQDYSVAKNDVLHAKPKTSLHYVRSYETSNRKNRRQKIITPRTTTWWNRGQKACIDKGT